MEHVWKEIDTLREKYEILSENRIPIDVLTFFEVDLQLDAIPFPDLFSRYRVEAAIKADFTGIYIDAEQYTLMEEAPKWKLKRLRFTVAHELGHFFLHKALPKPNNFASLHDFAQWTSSDRYKVEQEANEFAGRLLIPSTRISEMFRKFSVQIEQQMPNFMASKEVRNLFAETVGEKFGVNSQVIEMRLDREGIWPSA